MQSYCGASALEPVLAGKMILYVQEQGCRVRSLGYDFSSDSYTGVDLSLMANHLFETQDIRDWAFQREPDSIVWVVTNQGELFSLTYIQEQEVCAWARHPLGGGAVVESVAVLQTDEGDFVYFSVLRNGVRSIEFFDPAKPSDWLEENYLDGAVGVSAGSATVTQVSGLSHLAGMTVSALLDGNLARDMAVSGAGVVTLPYACSRAFVGVPYTAELESLDLTVQRQDGTQMTRRLRVSGCAVRVQKSRGVWCGTAESALQEFKDRSGEAYGAPVEPASGDLKFSLESGFDNGRVVVSAPYPFACTVLALVPQVAVPSALG